MNHMDGIASGSVRICQMAHAVLPAIGTTRSRDGGLQQAAPDALSLLVLGHGDAVDVALALFITGGKETTVSHANARFVLLLVYVHRCAERERRRERRRPVCQQPKSTCCACPQHRKATASALSCFLEQLWHDQCRPKLLRFHGLLHQTLAEAVALGEAPDGKREAREDEKHCRKGDALAGDVRRLCLTPARGSQWLMDRSHFFSRRTAWASHSPRVFLVTSTSSIPAAPVIDTLVAVIWSGDELKLEWCQSR
ncbi:hypothetical protein GQ600_13655 [Phytophthora cactorum]|nr:hypothetical protein GQ600_13655 [Phytophthora cactorum]